MYSLQKGIRQLRCKLTELENRAVSGLMLRINNTDNDDQETLNFIDSDSVSFEYETGGKVKAIAAGVGGGGTKILDTVADFNTFTTTEKVALVRDPIRGGVFIPYSGALSPDSGVIFLDGASRKWIRDVTDADHTNIRWYDTTDMNTVMDKISVLISSVENLVTKRVYIPKGTYEFSGTYTITVGMHIYGDGMGRSNIRFPDNVGGFVLSFPGVYDNYTFQNFTMMGRSVSSPVAVPLYSDWDSNAHGVVLSRASIFENVEINGFSGSGIYGRAQVPTNNINNSQFTGVISRQNKRHGVDLQGPDANAMKFINCDFSSNAGCGVRDYSFLGNHYITCHFASNGSPAIPWGARGLCKAIDGKIYACNVDDTIGVEPTVTSGWETSWILTSWTDVWTNIKPYDPTVTYISTANIFMKGLNQEGTLLGCYGEGDQMPGFIDQRNIWISGNMFLRNGLKYWAGGSKSFDTLQGIRFESIKDDLISVGQYITPGTGKVNIYDNGSGVEISYDRTTNIALLYGLGSTLLNIAKPNFYSGFFLPGNGSNKLLVHNSNTIPVSTANYPAAYIHYHTQNKIYDDFSETVLYKTVPIPLAGVLAPMDWVRLGGYVDYTFTTTDATPADKIRTLIRGCKVVVFDAEVSAYNVSAPDDIFYCKKKVLLKYNEALCTTVSDVETERYSDASLSGITLVMAKYLSGVKEEYLSLNCVGIAGTSIKWNLRIKRTRLS